MKNMIFCAVMAGLLSLSACGEVSTDSQSPKAVNAKMEKLEAKASADLSKMDVSEIIDYVNNEATDMRTLLEGVTDGPSAEAAVEDLRRTIPRLNAALKSMENMDVENMSLNFGNMRKMIKVAQSQVGLFDEVARISQIPEARAVLEKEFDKIEITNN